MKVGDSLFKVKIGVRRRRGNRRMKKVEMRKYIFLIDLNIFSRLRFTYMMQAYRHKHKKKYV